ncbi:restriction endonuclease subunit S [Methylophilaceae bacterium]|nr:restriction endonuclease subunit S [Methylophilaceae bacterium]
MSEWQKITFGEAVNFPPKCSLVKKEVYPYIELANINIGFKYVYSFGEQKYNGSGSKFENGDTLFARITPSLENGKIAQVKNLKKTGFGSGEFFIFRGKKGISDSDFIYYLSQTESFKNNAINSMVGASGRQRADNKFVAKTKINLPPLPTQQKIAKILSNYDDLIENNLKRIKLLEESARLTYEEWFLRFRIDGKKLDIDPESGLPFGWEKKSITQCDAFKQDNRKLKEFDGEKLYYATADVDGTEITVDGEIIKWLNKPSRAQIKPNNNTVWFARMSNTYKVLCFNNKNTNLQDSSVLSSGFAGFNAKNDSCLPFLYFTINSKFFHDLKDLYATGATQVSLNNDSMSYIKIIEPRSELIEKFGNKTLPLIEEISNLRSKNQLLKEARDILLPRLMTGMIDTDKLKVAA